MLNGMIRSSRLLLAGSVVAMALVVTPTAQAANPVNWEFFIETSGADVSWFSPTNLDTGFPAHTYRYEITLLEADTILGTADLLPELDEEDRSSDGVLGPLPLTLFNETLSESGNSATISLGIDEFGQGYAHMTDVSLSLISAVRIGGTIEIEAVPEPAGAAVLGLAGVALLARRRR